jgi:hypothetical protein
MRCTLRLIRNIRICDDYGQHTKASSTLWSHREGPIYPNHDQMHQMASRMFLPADGNTISTPSVQTQLIQCQYELHSVVQPQNGCCETQIVALLPVNVLSVGSNDPGFSEPPVQSPPAGWQPTVFDSQVRALSVQLQQMQSHLLLQQRLDPSLQLT